MEESEMQSWKGQDIRQIVDDPEWQELRLSFIGTWKSKVEENVIKLEKYLGDDPSEMKLVRVYNYLTGTGFRMGVIGNSETENLKNLVKSKLDKFKE
jgi:hypothetical protein